MPDHILAVDVGTGSARAGVFDLRGQQLARCVVPVSLHTPQARHMEQDSGEIWSAVCRAVRAALNEAGLAGADILAIGFDATCSLVVRDTQGQPLSISTTGAATRDTILWMDHRAIAETDQCNAIEDPLLARFGGRLSVEMQIPKLLWLKPNLPEIWRRAGLIFDLADYLTWRATGATARSHSPMASKWGYSPEAPGTPPQDFLAKAGLEDLMERAGLPPQSHPVHQPVGHLSAEAAEALGLTTACLVAPGLIDAYAGALGLFAAGEREPAPLAQEAAFIAGTSSCIIRLTQAPVSGPGCWGGFEGAAIPGLYLLEAGQSASGAFLDHVLKTHPGGGEPSQARHRAILDAIGARLQSQGRDFGLPIAVLPDIHGTRSPVSDPRLTASLAGLDLDSSEEGLLRLYWRSCVALACGISHILDHQPTEAGRPERLLLGGGFAGHALLAQLHADATGASVHVPANCDAVLLGTALHAAVTAGAFPSVHAAGEAMRFAMRIFTPQPEAAAALHRDKALHTTMIRHRAELTAIMLQQPDGTSAASSSLTPAAR